MFASVAAGGGHNTVRDGLVRAVNQTDPQHRIIRPISWTASHGFDAFYRLCVRLGIQGFIYKLSSFSTSAWVGLLFNLPLAIEAVRVLRREKPDIVVGTHLVLTAAMKLAVHLEGLNTRVISVIPDYGAPNRGFFPRFRALRASYTFVNGDDTYDALLADDAAHDDEVHQVGTVVTQAFREVAQQRHAAGGELGPLRNRWLRELAATQPAAARLDGSKPTVAFFGGSGFSGKTMPVIERLAARSDAGEAFNLVVLCGRDAELKRTLEPRFGDKKGHAVLGFLCHEELARLYALTDAPVMGSLAHSTLQEMLETATGPLLVFSVIPGTEPPYLDFLRKHAVGIYEPNADAMTMLVEEALGLREGERWENVARGFTERARRLRDASTQRSTRLVDQLLLTVGRKVHGHAPLAERIESPR